MALERVKSFLREKATSARELLQSDVSVAQISKAVGAAAFGVVTAAGGDSRAETLEQRLGNPDNYEPVEFVDRAYWCRVNGNTLRWGGGCYIRRCV